MKKFWNEDYKDKKIAFVCSGGVTKATAWHLGVSLALDDLGLQFLSQSSDDDIFNKPHVSTYVGSSAGTLLCNWITQGFKPHEILEAFVSPNTAKLKSISYRDMLSLKRVSKGRKGSRNYNIFENFPFFIQKMFAPATNVSGLFTTSGLADYLVENVIRENDFKKLKADLFIIASQLDRSRKVVFGKYNYPSPKYADDTSYYTGINIVDASAASMSVPPFYGPYPIKNPVTNNHDYYIDGEIRDTLSTHVAIDNNCDIIISSWTHGPYQYHTDIGSLVNYGLPAICAQSILLMIEKKIQSHRKRISMKKITLDSVHEYMKNEKFSDNHIRSILKILEEKLDYRPNVKFIDICPRESDYDLFFSSFFSLNLKATSRIVRMAYKRTHQVFKELEWHDI